MLLVDLGELRPRLVLLVPVERLPLGMRGRRTDAILSGFLLCVPGRSCEIQRRLEILVCWKSQYRLGVNMRRIFFVFALRA